MQLTPSGKRFLIIAGIVVVIVNVVFTLYLLRTVTSQGNRIQTLERNDKITQSVKSLDTKVESLKSKIQGLFH